MREDEDWLGEILAEINLVLGFIEGRAALTLIRT